MLCDLREGNTAVFRACHNAAAVYADERHKEVDDCHQQAAEDTGAHGVGSDSIAVLHAEAAYNVHDHDAEGKARKRIERVVALNEALEKWHGRIVARGLDLGDGSARVHERDDNEDAEEEQECGVEYLADPDHYLAGVEREQQRRDEEGQREQQQVQRELIRALRDDLLDTDSERGRCAAGDREERPYRQVQRAGEEITVWAADVAAQLKQTAAAADAERRDAEQRQTDAGDDEADERGPHVATGHLPHIDRENQVPRAEKHAEEHAGNVDVFTPTETFLHGKTHPLVNLSIPAIADGNWKLTYMITFRCTKGNTNYLMGALLNVIKRKDICIDGGSLISLTRHFLQCIKHSRQFTLHKFHV